MIKKYHVYFLYQLLRSMDSNYIEVKCLEGVSKVTVVELKYYRVYFSICSTLDHEYVLWRVHVSRIVCEAPQQLKKSLRNLIQRKSASPSYRKKFDSSFIDTIRDHDCHDRTSYIV